MANELSGFFGHMKNDEAESALAEATVDQIHNGVFRDNYIDTVNEVMNGTSGDLASALENVEMDTALSSLSLEMALQDIVSEGKNCSSCGECDKNPAIEKAIDILPETDPTDAGTFFSNTKGISAEECTAEGARMMQETRDLIGAIIPDTSIE